MTGFAVFNTSVPSQRPVAFAGHLTWTGALPCLTVTVCVGIPTPLNLKHAVGLVPGWFVAFGVGEAIWTPSPVWRCADFPSGGTAPWNEPVPEVLTKCVMQPQ